MHNRCIWYLLLSHIDDEDFSIQVMELATLLGPSICVRTLSTHCMGPLRCTSIQQGIEVTGLRLPRTQSVSMFRTNNIFETFRTQPLYNFMHELGIGIFRTHAYPLFNNKGHRHWITRISDLKLFQYGVRKLSLYILVIDINIASHNQINDTNGIWRIKNHDKEWNVLNSTN